MVIVTNKPQLRFSLFKEDWKEVKLKNITSKIGSGKTPFGGEKVYSEQGIPFIRSQNVNNDRLVLDDTFITSDIHLEMKGSTVLPNDILLNITGASIGRSCVVPNDFIEGNVNQHVCIIRTQEAEPRFIQSYLSSWRGQKLIYQSQTGSGREGINFESIGKFKLYLPTRKEQQKIATFLSAVDRKIELLEQKKTLLEEYKKGVMQKLFSREIRFEDENGEDFPEWEEKTLSSFLIERKTLAPKSEKYPLMAFIAGKGVAPKGDRYNREFLVNDVENKNYKQTEYGDFIYSSNNFETGSIGLNLYGNASISPVYGIFRIAESCDQQFVGNYLIRKSFLYKMIKYRQGVVYGQWRIHESDFLKIKERMPSKNEQIKIGKFLSAIELKIDQVKKVLKLYKLFKKGLLQQMFV